MKYNTIFEIYLQNFCEFLGFAPQFYNRAARLFPFPHPPKTAFYSHYFAPLSKNFTANKLSRATATTVARLAY